MTKTDEGLPGTVSFAEPGRTADTTQPADALPDELPPGTRIGDYEIIAPIAHGGMGVVYRARQVTVNRVVALKMILSGQLASEQMVRRFYAEAEAAAGLDHPGIVPIFEAGEQQGWHFFSMGLVQGTSLADRVSRHPLEPREAVRLMADVARAVHYAHQRGVIHRDLKPSNILVDADGQPRVTDFGLAKQVQGDSELTQAGAVLGTPSFMPPEQASGRMDEVGPLADVYSLGATLYCLLTARPPFQSARVGDTLRQVIEREPVSPRQLNAAVDRDLETICLKCLEKEIPRRYDSAGDLAADLDRYLEGRPIVARPISPVGRLVRWCRRSPQTAALAGAFLLALVGGTVVSTYFAIESSLNAGRYRQESLRANAETGRALIRTGGPNFTLHLQQVQASSRPRRTVAKEKRQESVFRQPETRRGRHCVLLPDSTIRGTLQPTLEASVPEHMTQPMSPTIGPPHYANVPSRIGQISQEMRPVVASWVCSPLAAGCSD